MRRREFITLLGGMAVAWPIAARAQQPERMRRIGVLMGYPENDLEGPAFFAAFRERLEKLGWVENRNIRFDTRWATPEDAEARRRFAQELVALQPDLILSGVTPTTAALLEQTRTIPIVFATVADPVGSVFVASFARPGGNVTGFRLPSIRAESSLKSAGCYPTELTSSNRIGKQRPTLIASSRARSRASFPSRPRSSSSWRSISRPQRRSASTCLCIFSNLPTR